MPKRKPSRSRVRQTADRYGTAALQNKVTTRQRSLAWADEAGDVLGFPLLVQKVSHNLELWYLQNRERWIKGRPMVRRPTKLPEDWPPSEWRNDVRPRDDSLDAIRQWFRLWVGPQGVLRNLNSPVFESFFVIGNQPGSCSDVVHDTFLLLRHSEAEGILTVALGEERIEAFNAHTARAELERLEGLLKAVSPPVFSTIQRRILEVLEGEAYSADQLAAKVGIDRRTLFKADDLVHLKQGGHVKNDRKVGGYYRPDAPPRVKSKGHPKGTV